MKHWLAFDTSSDLACFSLKSGEKIFQRQIQGVGLHAEQALFQIQALLDEAKIKVTDLSGIVLGRGPGSFTGLRVASAIAKGLAYGRQLPIYPVSNLALMAWQAQKLYPNTAILAVMDARMQQVYWAYFPVQAVEIEEQVSNLDEIPLPSEPWVLASFRLPQIFAASKHMIAECPVEMSSSSMIEMLEAGFLSPVSAENLEPVYVRNQVTHGS